MPPNPEPNSPISVTLSSSDGSLLRQVNQGKEDAATKLYRRYADRLRGLVRAQCSHHLAQRVEADDIIQSVFRTFFRGVRQGLYDVPKSDDLWKLLFVITLNKVRAEGHFHQASRRDVRRTQALGDEGTPGNKLHPLQCSTGFLEMIVQDTLEQLPELTRRIVQLRMEGFQVAEIAKQTERSKRTVERNLQEARAKLKNLLAD